MDQTPAQPGQAPPAIPPALPAEAASPILEYERPIPTRRPGKPLCLRIASTAVYAVAGILLVAGAAILLISILNSATRGGGVAMAWLFLGGLLWFLENAVMQHLSRISAVILGVGILFVAVAIASGSLELLRASQSSGLLGVLATAFVAFCGAAHLVWAVQRRASRRRRV